MRAHARRREIDAIVIWRLDRWSHPSLLELIAMVASVVKRRRQPDSSQ